MIERPQGRLVGTLAVPSDGRERAADGRLPERGRDPAHRAASDVGRRREAVGARGVTSLRLDLEGIGDSDGDGELFGDVAHFHGAQFFDQTRAALDALEEAGLGTGSSWSACAPVRTGRFTPRSPTTGSPPP